MDKTCFIFGAGDYEGTKVDINNVKNGFIVAADGGLLFLDEHGITPDLLVGDFDSMAERESYDIGDENIIRHPVMKDDTDMMLSLKEGLNRGYKKFVIYGGMGGRLDHTIANIQSLAYLALHGAHGYLIGGRETVTVIKDGKLQFDAGFSGMISVFSAGDCAKGVTLRGLLYELDDYTLVNTMPLGVSNEFCGKDSYIEVKDGMLIVMWENSKNITLPMKK